MQRINLDANTPNFIGVWQLNKPTLCQDIIDFFEQHRSLQKPGRSARGLNYNVKKSTDITIKPRELHNSSHNVLSLYMNELLICYHDYLEQWPFLKNMLDPIDIGEFNIQRYDSGGHFARVHSERTNLEHAHRVLVWMTYLNDVNDGGETNFTHYGFDVKPEQGKTLIWPAEWTHAHSGKAVTTGRKYIITGWMHFPLPKIEARHSPQN